MSARGSMVVSEELVDPWSPLKGSAWGPGKVAVLIDVVIRTSERMVVVAMFVVAVVDVTVAAVVTSGCEVVFSSSSSVLGMVVARTTSGRVTPPLASPVPPGPSIGPGPRIRKCLIHTWAPR